MQDLFDQYQYLGSSPKIFIIPPINSTICALCSRVSSGKEKFGFEPKSISYQNNISKW